MRRWDQPKGRWASGGVVRTAPCRRWATAATRSPRLGCVCGGGGGEGGGARPWTRRAARSRLGAQWTRSGGPAGTAALGDRFLLLLRENGREGGRIAGSGFRRLSDGERPALMGSPQAPCALLTAAPLHGDGCERGIRNRSTSPLQGGL